MFRTGIDKFFVPFKHKYFINGKKMSISTMLLIPLVSIRFYIYSYSNDKQAILKICSKRDLKKNMNCSTNIEGYFEENYILWESV